MLSYFCAYAALWNIVPRATLSPDNASPIYFPFLLVFFLIQSDRFYKFLTKRLLKISCGTGLDKVKKLSKVKLSSHDHSLTRKRSCFVRHYWIKSTEGVQNANSCLVGKTTLISWKMTCWIELHRTICVTCSDFTLWLKKKFKEMQAATYLHCNIGLE